MMYENPSSDAWNGRVGRGGAPWWGPVGRDPCARDSIWDRLGVRRDSTTARSARPEHEKRGSRSGYPVSFAVRYSSKRRRNRSSMRLVNEPPLLRRWRVDPGADPELAGLPASRGPVIA